MPAERVIDTDRKTQVVDVTALCQSLIAEAKNGIAVFNVLNRTAALIKCEDEPNLRDDLARVAEHWLAHLRPFQHGRYGAPNAEAHITSALAGTALTLPIVDGKLLLGSCQSILRWSWTDRGGESWSARLLRCKLN